MGVCLRGWRMGLLHQRPADTHYFYLLRGEDYMTRPTQRVASNACRGGADVIV